MNANKVPLGSRKRKLSHRESSPPMFDPVEWNGWKPISKDKADCQFISGIKNGVADIKDMVESFQGTVGDNEYKDIKFYDKFYNDLLTLMEGGFKGEERNKIETLKMELDENKEVLMEKVEGEDRTMKSISKVMAELEEEIIRYHSDRTTNKYDNVRKRMGDVTRQLSSFKPAREQNKIMKVKHNARLADKWQEFELRSDSLVEYLEQQMEKEIPVTVSKDEE